jgi:hypothetical protein
MSLDIPNGVKSRYKTRSNKRTLLRLPLEIRTRIYEEVFQSARTFYHRGNQTAATGYELLLTSRSVYEEAIDLYYKYLTLIVEDFGAWGLIHMLPKNPNDLKNIAKIQKLSIVTFRSLPALSQFRGLRQATLSYSNIIWVPRKTVLETNEKIQECILAPRGPVAVFHEQNPELPTGIEFRWRLRLETECVCHFERVVSIWRHSRIHG